MGLIVYVIELNSSELHCVINKNIKELSDFVFYETNDGGDFKYEVFEGKLINEEITINFDGKINFIKTFIKHSQFLNFKAYQDRVLNFEKKMYNFFEFDINIYRVDESLFETLVIDKGEFWYRENNAYEVFKEWIVNQEKLHWRKLIPTDTRL